ncbi:hypothetical protein GURASL_28510 [Geotalea uraniireducens]|uniref:Phosphatidylglycerol lysyltransferase C-terminal domain-containing protein n=1 Tax=Geotalea uraniireducens TaxID=351604 RepID=A0ABM8EMX3_9BACT|nr:phosphatidylglycerol lysyltransferase domain-containing protein [Geotalea uraniireducens]BDV43928.1 hypothetical protein GURASL_28510 [Geotalea uraniireducens]
MTALPAYPGCRPLELADRELFAGRFAALQPRVSELTFAGLYLFRHAHDYRLAALGDTLLIFGSGYGGDPYVLPPLGGDVRGAVARLLADGLALYGADDRFVERQLTGLAVELTEDRDNFDYLYLRRELAELPGNRFHKKRNRISYFEARHAYRVDRYAAGYRDGCLALTEEWRRVRGDLDSPSLRLETAATAEALQLADQLGLAGVVVTVEGVVKAFALGERLNDETAVCHFEKADPFMDGLYQLVDREFCRLAFPDCTYVNREQDLGEPNLRKSKLSYQPVELVRKFRVTRP